jgi:hypothetical protein
MPNGRGIQVIVKEGIFIGNFVQGTANGIGLIVSANGNVSIGNFKNNKRHGKFEINFREENLPTQTE